MSFEVEINTANAPDGEPLIVIKLGESVTVLTLDDATEISLALTKAVAASVIKEPVTPKAPPLIQLSGV